MKYVLIPAIVLLGWGQPAIAADINLSDVRCVKWTEKRGGELGRFHLTETDEYLIAALNLVTDIRHRLFMNGRVNYNSMWEPAYTRTWFDKHCYDNPTQNLMQAADNLIQFLENTATPFE